MTEQNYNKKYSIMITIRKADEKDFIQIIELFKEFALFEKMPEKMLNTLPRMLEEKEYFNCFVAETEERKLVGYITYFITYHTWIGKSMYIDDLYVKPDYRGMSIGSNLMNRLIQLAKESGCHKLRWQVSNWNQPAIDFYKSLGAEIGSTEMNCDLKL